jgi:hypothetical protein
MGFKILRMKYYRKDPVNGKYRALISCSVKRGNREKDFFFARILRPFEWVLFNIQRGAAFLNR